MKNLGVIIERKPEDFVGGTLPYEVLNPSGDWTPFLPSAENQFTHHTDSMACVTFSCLNVIETQIKFLTGRSVNFSDRFIAKVSGTTPQGNSVQRVLDAINKYGLVLEQDWPTDFEFNWDQYYAEIPQEVFDRAKQLRKELFGDVEKIVNYEFHWGEDDQLTQLKHVPLEVIIEQNNPYHSVTRVNQSQQFDHYPPNLRPLRTINLATKILLNGVKTMTIGYKKVGDPTTYVSVGSQLVPIADWGAFIALGGSNESVVELSQEQFAKFQTINSVLFKTK